MQAQDQLGSSQTGILSPPLLREHPSPRQTLATGTTAVCATQWQLHTSGFRASSVGGTGSFPSCSGLGTELWAGHCSSLRALTFERCNERGLQLTQPSMLRRANCACCQLVPSPLARIHGFRHIVDDRSGLSHAHIMARLEPAS